MDNLPKTQQLVESMDFSSKTRTILKNYLQNSSNSIHPTLNFRALTADAWETIREGLHLNQKEQQGLDAIALEEFIFDYGYRSMPMSMMDENVILKTNFIPSLSLFNKKASQINNVFQSFFNQVKNSQGKNKD